MRNPVPLYEYQCATCGRFELIRKFSDQPLSVCPTCGQEVQKLLSAPAIQFKGSGWYITDYARKGGTGASESDGASKSGSDGASKSGSDGASKSGGDGAGKSSDSTSSPQTSTSKDSSASGSSSSK